MCPFENFVWSDWATIEITQWPDKDWNCMTTMVKWWRGYVGFFPTHE
jgi:hypothetical protein